MAIAMAVALSADGTKVLFNSDANNAAISDTNNVTDAFIKDLTTGEITRVSTDSGDKEVQGSAIVAVGMSADGTKVLLQSNSANLVFGDNNDAYDVFVKDLKTGAVTRVSTNYEDTEANGDSEGYAISADGTKVLFDSNADNLVDGDTNRAYDVFVKNIETGEVTRVSTYGKTAVKRMAQVLAAHFRRMARKSYLIVWQQTCLQAMKMAFKMYSLKI
jgi:Tol biopolymer transport system component